MPDDYENGYAASRSRFERDTDEHEMTALRDDGLYRHLRFARPGTYMYGYDVVTWPGYLAFVGDMGDYLFSRTADMFEFFADGTSGRASTINPHYWGEKLRGPEAGRTAAERFSIDAYQARVRGWLREQEARILPSAITFGESAERVGHAPPADVLTYLDEIEYDYGERDVQRLLDLREAVEGDLLDSWVLPHTEESAIQRLLDFEHDGIRIDEPYYWSFREWDGRFLWCCWAIASGIRQYRAAEQIPEVAHA